MKPRLWKDQRGIATVYLGVSILALVAVATLGADIGRVAFTATEVQNAADVVAITGAKQLVLGSGSPRVDAESVLHENAIDGNPGQGSQIQAFEIGNYDVASEVFMNGGEPANAVRAVVQTEIDNILGDLVGAPKSTVTKTATAAFGGLGAGQPTLPIAVGDCNFPDDDCFEDACLPKLVQVPNGEDNSSWTGFFDGANKSTIEGFFPEGCKAGTGGVTPPTIRVGNNINLNNGQIEPLLPLMQDCLDAGINEFVVPIIQCGINYVQSAPVLGFATITIDEVKATGNPKYLKLSAIVNTNEPGPPGGHGFGSGSVVLVK